MIGYEGDKIFVAGDVIRTAGEGVTLKISKEDADTLRDDLRDVFEGVDDKYIPGWMKKGNIVNFKSRYPVPVFVNDAGYQSMEQLRLMYGGAVFRDSRIVCCITARKGKGIFLKSIVFACVKTTTLNNFFKKGGDV